MSKDEVRQRRLPNGTFTTNVNTYLYVWRQLAYRALIHFPGYTIQAFDPDLALVRWGKNRFEETIVADRVVLSVQAAEALTDATYQSRDLAVADLDKAFGKDKT